MSNLIHHHVVIAHVIDLAVHAADRLLIALNAVNLLNEIITFLWPIMLQLWA